MLRHWSAWSEPAGRLFCKSNRRTALRWSSLSPPPAPSPRLPPLSSFPFFTLFFRPLGRTSLRRGRHFIFRKRPASAHFRSFVRSFVLPTQRRLSALSIFFFVLLFLFSPSLSLSLSHFLSFFLWSRCRAAYGGAMANSAPDSHEAGRKRTDLDRKNRRVLYRWCEYLEHDDPEKPRVIPIFSSCSGWFLRMDARSSIDTLAADVVDRSFWVIVAGKRKLKCAVYSL